MRREVTLGQSRIDFLLEQGKTPPCWLEVKSVTLVDDGVARFPDAPTARNRRHLMEIARAVKDGDHGAVVFVVQREDAARFSPHDQADPAFGRALRYAVGAAWRYSRCAVG